MLPTSATVGFLTAPSAVALILYFYDDWRTIHSSFATIVARRKPSIPCNGRRACAIFEWLNEGLRYFVPRLISTRTVQASFVRDFYHKDGSSNSEDGLRKPKSYYYLTGNKHQIVIQYFFY
ncbi:hypothetical protein PsorP6_001340 [Peronosclerospora sorghi]|uniref:Uncharacterized protein n=1 Tax=Peronosclerospora sorghi TaxID=230839 RepID=A0ACC0WSF9_9STRA|nr:hypothetical protein PsorP6_001340 [Peronosclerospora sorghi]